MSGGSKGIGVVNCGLRCDDCGCSGLRWAWYATEEFICELVDCSNNQGVVGEDAWSP